MSLFWTNIIWLVVNTIKKLIDKNFLSNADLKKYLKKSALKHKDRSKDKIYLNFFFCKV